MAITAGSSEIPLEMDEHSRMQQRLQSPQCHQFTDPHHSAACSACSARHKRGRLRGAHRISATPPRSPAASPQTRCCPSTAKAKKGRGVRSSSDAARLELAAFGGKLERTRASGRPPIAEGGRLALTEYESTFSQSGVLMSRCMTRMHTPHPLAHSLPRKFSTLSGRRVLRLLSCEVGRLSRANFLMLSRSRFPSKLMLDPERKSLIVG